MAKKLDNEQCSAWVIMHIGEAGALLPCRTWGNGKCLLEARREAGIDADVHHGECLGDTDDGPLPVQETRKAFDWPWRRKS